MENVPAKNTLLAINVTNALPDFSDFPNAKVVKITNSSPIFILHLFKKISECGCSAEGALDSSCNENGICSCKEHVTGDKCDACVTGFLGFPSCDQCDETFHGYPNCEACECNTEGSVSTACTDGKCQCKPNVTGDKCDEVEPGYYDFPDPKECECDAEGSVDRTCDNISGKCTCKEHVVGDKCTECAAEHYGFPNCQACMCSPDGSENNLCNTDTGHCYCKIETIGGNNCEKCAARHFGYPDCHRNRNTNQCLNQRLFMLCLLFRMYL